MTPNGAVAEIKNVTAALIAAGMSIDQNFPSCRSTRLGHIVGFSGQDELAVTLKNVAYLEAYNMLRDARSFNALLPDGGMIQLLYYFERGKIAKHRLLFLPSPDLVEYQNEVELYEADDRYADTLYKGVVTSPLRFDFDP